MKKKLDVCITKNNVLLNHEKNISSTMHSLPHFLKKSLPLFACCIIGTIQALAQTPNLVEDFKKLQQVQKQLNGDMSIEGEYMLYSSASSAQPTELVPMQIRRQGDNMYSKMGTIESLSNQLYNISINNQDRYAVVTQRIKGKAVANDAKTPDPAAMMKQLEKYGKYSAAANPEKGERGLCFESKAGEMEKIEYFYDANTFLPSRYIMYYRSAVRDGVPEAMKQPKVVLRYTKVEAKPVFAADAFSEQKYFKLATGKKGIVLQGAYANYRIIGQDADTPSAPTKKTKSAKKKK
jgi:hypothetical protein